MQGLTPDQALDKVVDGECEAALVDISALVAYQNIKPGLGKMLKVLKDSGPLPSAIVVCRKGALTDKQVKAIRDGLLDCTKSAEGRFYRIDVCIGITSQCAIHRCFRFDLLVEFRAPIDTCRHAQACDA